MSTGKAVWQNESWRARVLLEDAQERVPPLVRRVVQGPRGSACCLVTSEFSRSPDVTPGLSGPRGACQVCKAGCQPERNLEGPAPAGPVLPLEDAPEHVPPTSSGLEDLRGGLRLTL